MSAFPYQIQAFSSRQLVAAIKFAASGGLALHLHSIINDKTAPIVFRRAVKNGEPIAHLFGKDRDVLLFTIRKLGVRVRRIERADTDKQHIDLCCSPLRRALALCEDQARVTELLKAFSKHP